MESYFLSRALITLISVPYYVQYNLSTQIVYLL